MKVDTLLSHLFIAASLQMVHGQSPLDDFVSNVQEAVKPAQSAAENVFGDIGNNIASAANQAGNFAASAASDAISAVNSYQEDQISSELSSYHSSTSRLYRNTLMLASTSLTVVICLCNYI
ncbi:hypothetical protein COEREDRAFT_80613 [Coemansia reversa NRRL 1564]|uniref:Uncharacterized protein n=1 Tax=Coemansia reversa (strain ATCC 12441 / NRRL 1564) TaxID=763665 RepID=A0A2G5BE53_COERN|nr:hypothetical protein COEREDRAFT_80613 [Coemansia reversa NRRL 1564]|eukprot:PIA17272.1 hypothetical protein COEREDRAFT_80613 [Coemansia reversa NRRL 1564]